jgi:hypothetical protein
MLKSRIAGKVRMTTFPGNFNQAAGERRARKMRLSRRPQTLKAPD